MALRTPAEQARMLAALQRRWGAVRHDTPLSIVLVAGDSAWKFRRMVDTGFAHFLSIDARRADAEAELALNRRFAPGLYRAVHPFTGPLDEAACDGPGPVLDWALQMQAFPPEALWTALARRGALDAAHIDALAEVLQSLRASAPVLAADDPLAAPAAWLAVLEDNLQRLHGLLPDEADRLRLQALGDALLAQGRRLLPRMAQRAAQGHVRDGHGDLHLGNLVQWQGRPTPFDGLEFSRALRCTDTVSELAFISMDLMHHGLAGLAHRLVNAVLEADDDRGAAPLLRLHQAHRALVRATVASLAGQQDEAWRRLALAERLAAPPAPALWITHGLSGSGKSTQSQLLLERVGALRLRADVERKRLAGLAPLQRGEPALYTRERTAEVHEHLFSQAAALLAGGCSVVLDATFLRRHWRDRARACAAAQGVPLHILACEAPPAVLAERLRQRLARGADASDATEAVLAQQIASAEALDEDERALVRPLPPAAPGPGR